MTTTRPPMNDNVFRRIVRESVVLAAAVRFAYQFVAACVWIWKFIIRRVLIPFEIVGGWIYRKWRAMWDKVVYDRFGFNYRRAGMFLTATLVVAYFASSVLWMAFQITLYVATSSTDRVYLTFSQEIYPDDDIHSVKGCTERPCTDQNTVYYRVAPSAFNHLWSLAVNWDIFYPDEVAAAVPPGISDCTVHRYGIRQKFLMRKADIYPDALQITCQPVLE